MNDRDALGKTVTRTPAAAPSEAREPLPVQPEGRYAVPDAVQDPTLGRGGMGRVLGLVDLHLQRDVAVKEMLPEHTAARSTSGPLYERLFIREARVLALLEHPGVVPVYELGRRPDGTPYYAMRRIRGRSLQQALDACVSLDERLALLSHFIDVVQTIGFAHSRGVIHRDLKPENVMVGPFGETQVIDWGLALVKGEPLEGSVVAGTPAYMSPEQASGTRVDARSDVWALGVMLFELLAGALPFKGAGGTEVLDSVLHQPIPSLRSFEPGVPPALAAVVDRALSRDASLRYQDAGQMADALEAAQRARAPRPVVLWATLAVLGLAVVAFGALAWSHASAADDARRDARLSVAHAERASADAIAQASLSALREHDLTRAHALASSVPGHPLARGVEVLVEAQGLPVQHWAVVTEAGCSAVASVGSLVACATFGGVSLWHADGTSAGRLSTGPTGWQHAVVAAGPLLVSGGDDRVVHVWNPETRVEVRRVDGILAPIRSIAVDGAALVVGLGDGLVLRVLESGRVEEVTRHPRPVTQLAVLPGQVASVSEGLLRVTGPQPTELDRHVGAVQWVSAQRLALGVERALAFVGDAQATTLGFGHRDAVTALVSLDGRVVTGSGDGSVRWWFGDGSAEGVLSSFSPGVQALAATADGKLVVATRARGLSVWSLPAPRRAPDNTGVPSAHAWWAGSGGVISGYRDGRVRRWDPESGESRELELRHSGPVRALARAWNEGGVDAWRFLSGGDDGRVLGQRWNGDVEPLDTLAGARVTTVVTSRQGSLAAWAADDGSRVVWNLALGKEVFRAADSRVLSAAFSPDGRFLAWGREDRHVELVDAQTGKAPRVMGPVDGAVTAVAFSGDGKWLAAGSSDGRVTVFLVETGAQVRSWNCRGAVRSLDWHQSGVLAVGSDDGAVWLLQQDQGEPAAELPLDAGDTLFVSFTEAGLVAIGTDRVLHVLKP